jgi:hypothetical protein
MHPSINDLGNILIFSLLFFAFVAMLGGEVPLLLFVCHIVVILACIVAGN